MRVTVFQFDATPEEFGQVDIKALLGEDRVLSEGNGAAVPKASEVLGNVPVEIRDLVRSKASGQQADLCLRFMGTVLSWGAVRPNLGGTNRTDGESQYVRLTRIPQRKGAFVYVHPRSGKLNFRLRASETPQATLATTRKSREYEVQVDLADEASLSHSLEFAKLAYDRATDGNG